MSMESQMKAWYCQNVSTVKCTSQAEMLHGIPEKIVSLCEYKNVTIVTEQVLQI